MRVRSTNSLPKQPLTVIVGTRGSPLALAQTDIVLSALGKKSKSMNNRRLGAINFVVEKIKTAGDEDRSSSTTAKKNNNKEEGASRMASYTGKDSFTGALDGALIDGRIDIAVHSLKDVPVEGFRGDEIEILAFPKRESPYDVLIPRRKGETLATLPPKPRVGTSSIRRAIQLRAARPDLEVVELHGNVGTRISKLRSSDSDLDAIVLAAAGLKRLGFLSLVEEEAQVLSAKVMLPAVGQGCLAVAVRRRVRSENDARIRRLVSGIDDKDTRLSVLAERAFSRELGGGCNLPLAALARISKGLLILEGLVQVPGPGHESVIARSKISGHAGRAESLGVELARRLKKGAYREHREEK